MSALGGSIFLRIMRDWYMDEIYHYRPRQITLMFDKYSNGRVGAMRDKRALQMSLAALRHHQRKLADKRARNGDFEMMSTVDYEDVEIVWEKLPDRLVLRMRKIEEVEAQVLIEDLAEGGGGSATPIPPSAFTLSDLDG